MIYKDVTDSVMYSSGIGLEPVSVSSYIFDPGTFTIVVTGREDACENMTSAECSADKKSVGSIHFTISPTINTPTKYVHTE